jgi:hypothetical protein
MVQLHALLRTNDFLTKYRCAPVAVRGGDEGTWGAQRPSQPQPAALNSVVMSAVVVEGSCNLTPAARMAPTVCPTAPTSVIHAGP